MTKFKWWIAERGFEWETDEDVPIPASMITPDPETGCYPPCHLAVIKNCFREYEPDAGLFRTFAEIPPTPVDILHFVNQYGHLGDELAELSYELEPPVFTTPDEEKKWQQEANRFVHLFDSLKHWINAIRDMRTCVQRWDLAIAGQKDEYTIPEILDKVNYQLSGNRFRVAFARDRAPSGFTMQIVPSNLLGALWMQLGESITQNKRFRACSTCKKWFELSPPISRTSRNYCSEACRSRAYRGRKEQATRMAAMGKNIAEIADVLNSTVCTVDTWLKQRKDQ